MADGGHNFDKQSIDRISKAVRTVEATQHTDEGYRGGRHQGGSINYPPMLQAAAAMVADDTAYDATYLEADGTAGATITVRRPYGIYIANDDVGFLGIDTDGMAIFIPGLATPLDPAGPPNTVGTIAETEAAQTDDWDVGDGTLEFIQLSRMAYAHAGDSKLYAYYRTSNYDAAGRLTSVSTETRVEIDAPEVCT